MNISSFVTRFPGQPGLAFYGLSKVALSHLSKSLNAELDGTEIRVVAVELGAFATEIYPPNRLVPNPSSPDEILVADVDQGIADLIANAADPAIAASAIVNIVDDPAGVGRVLVGDDAVEAVAAYQRELIIEWQSSTDS